MPQLPLNKFKQIVAKSVQSLSNEIKEQLKDIQIVIDIYPSDEQLIGTGLENKLNLLSLYEGIPLSEKYGYENILPDKITLFQESLESISIIEDQLIKEIQNSISSEISHQIKLSEN